MCRCPRESLVWVVWDLLGSGSAGSHGDPAKYVEERPYWFPHSHTEATLLKWGPEGDLNRLLWGQNLTPAPIADCPPPPFRLPLSPPRQEGDSLTPPGKPSREMVPCPPEPGLEGQGVTQSLLRKTDVGLMGAETCKEQSRIRVAVRGSSTEVALSWIITNVPNTHWP